MIRLHHVVAAALITGTLSPVAVQAQPSTPKLPILAKLSVEKLAPSMISPDGRFVAATIDSTELILLSLRDGRRVRVADGPIANDYVAYRRVAPDLRGARCTAPRSHVAAAVGAGRRRRTRAALSQRVAQRGRGVVGGE